MNNSSPIKRHKSLGGIPVNVLESAGRAVNMPQLDRGQCIPAAVVPAEFTYPVVCQLPSPMMREMASSKRITSSPDIG